MTLWTLVQCFSIVEFIPRVGLWHVFWGETCSPPVALTRPARNCRQWNVFFPTMNPQGKAHLCYLEIHMDPSHLENDLTVLTVPNWPGRAMSTLSRLLHSMNLRVVRFESQALSPIGVYIVKNSHEQVKFSLFRAVAYSLIVIMFMLQASPKYPVLSRSTLCASQRLQIQTVQCIQKMKLNCMREACFWDEWQIFKCDGNARYSGIYMNLLYGSWSPKCRV